MMIGLGVGTSLIGRFNTGFSITGNSTGFGLMTKLDFAIVLPFVIGAAIVLIAVAENTRDAARTVATVVFISFFIVNFLLIMGFCFW